MLKIYTLVLVFLTAININAQSAKSAKPAPITHKLGSMMLYRQLQQPEYAHSSKLKNIMVQGDPAIIRSLVERYRGTYKYSAGKISSVAIPYKNLIAFSQSTAVERIEASEIGVGRGRAFMDTARIQNNVDSVQLGYAPLAQAYKGTGVLVGIIDGGIYYHHQDFRRANGNTRVLYIWDQADTSGGHPTGNVWDSTSINNGTCGHKEPSSDQGHGTNVAGIATGNGLSWDTGDAYLKGRYTGVAPDADMIVVSVDNNRDDYLAAIADAVQFIFDKADQLGRPCVVNTSIGTYYGPHDGSDLSVKAMENMLDQKKGRVIVAAAGNGGAVKHHLSYQLNPTDSLFTWFTYNSATQQVYFDLWADTAQFRNANFALGCDKNTGVFQNRSRYFNALADFHPAPGATVEIDDSLFNGTTKLCDYGIAVTAYQGLYHIEFFAFPTLTTYLWRLQTIGTGTFDLWASKSLINTSSIATAYPSGFSSPNYRYGDSLKTIVSGWQCSDKVITVANYYNRAGYYDMDSNFVDLTISPYSSVVGALSVTSSIGPTRDGRMKPDISATGDVTTSTGDSTYISLLIGSNQRYKVSLGGKHTRNGGTSMASPLVAGVAALYLQKHPNAAYSEVKTVIERTAKRDTFTSFVNIPNVRFGYGKINAFQALKYNVIYGCPDTAAFNYVATANIDTGCVPKVYGCTDTGSINYNGLANTNNGACVAKIYGCLDTGSINYNASANVSNGNCVPKVYGCLDTGSINYSAAANVSNGNCVAKVYGITDSTCRNYNVHANVTSGVCDRGVGIIEAAEDLSLDVVPNPFGDNTMIYIHTQNALPNAEIRFYDQLGKSIDAITLPANTKEISYKNTKLAAGIYDMAIVSNGSIIAVKKVIVE